MAEGGNPHIPLGYTISTRDSSMTKDAINYNVYPSKGADGKTYATRRFGVQASAVIGTGNSLGLFAFNGTLVEIVGTKFYVNGVNKGTVDGTSIYQFTLTGQGGTAMFAKNNSAAYTWDGTTLTHVTDANYPATTVPGVAYLDGYVFVEDPQGRVWNSNLNTPAVWNALNFISGSLGSDPGVGISRLYNYVASFCQFSTTFFYDAGNTPPGSPLLPNTSAVINVGCASGRSIVATENTVFWVGQTRQKGRSVYIMNGLNPQAVSDQYIDRVLNSDPLINVYAFFIRTNGHSFYVLTLGDSNVTLVYDLLTSTWVRWSTTVTGTSLNVVSATLVNGILTLYIPNHGITNGTIVNVSGTGSSGNLLGNYVPTVIDSNYISYPVSTTNSLNGAINDFGLNEKEINATVLIAGTNTIGTLTVTPYLQNQFNQTFYAFLNNTDFLLGLTDGTLYNMQEGLSKDNGAFIYSFMRTEAMDMGSNTTKFFSMAELIADKVSDVCYLGYSDDDFATFRAYRPINMGAQRCQLRRLAAARRRAFGLLYFGSFAPRFFNLELQVVGGTQ